MTEILEGKKEVNLKGVYLSPSTKWTPCWSENSRVPKSLAEQLVVEHLAHTVRAEGDSLEFRIKLEGLPSEFEFLDPDSPLHEYYCFIKTTGTSVLDSNRTEVGGFIASSLEYMRSQCVLKGSSKTPGLKRNVGGASKNFLTQEEIDSSCDIGIKNETSILLHQSNNLKTAPTTPKVNEDINDELSQYSASLFAAYNDDEDEQIIPSEKQTKKNENLTKVNDATDFQSITPQRVKPVCWKPPTPDLGIDQPTSDFIQETAYILLCLPRTYIEAAQRMCSETLLGFVANSTMAVRYFRYVLNAAYEFVKKEGFKAPEPIANLLDQTIEFLGKLHKDMLEIA